MSLWLVLSYATAWSQSWNLKGVVRDTEDNLLENVQVQVLGTTKLAETDSLGHFSIQIDERQKTTFRFSLLGYEHEYLTISNPLAQENHEIVLSAFRQSIGVVDIHGDKSRTEAGTIKIGIDKVENLPSAIGGVEGFLKILVGSNNELTSQYTVRGGSYDENLVYVNDFEIYRPFLVRSGQQEGLSFINPDLVQNIHFSVGGFQSKYGDKLSSVLDVGYKRPSKFGGSVHASLLGAQAHLEGASKNVRFLVGARQKSNQYLLGSQPIKGTYEPSFTDFQGMVDITLHKKLDLQILGNYARNRFKFLPQESSQAFGVVNQVLRLRTLFDGQEDDAFDTKFLGISLSHYWTDKLQLKWMASGFQSQEYERYDIKGLYALYEVESDLGKKEFGQDKLALGTAEVHKFARNELHSQVLNFGHKGTYDGDNHFLQWGGHFKKIKVEDHLNEWHRRDSAKFTQPYHPKDIIMEFAVQAEHLLTYETFDFYVQDNIIFDTKHKMNLNVGLRSHYNHLNKEWIWSPRLQWSIAPDWDTDIIFKFASGMYAQPAFYREMRNLDGTLNTALKAQKSWHWTGGFDYNFTAFTNRPFKLTGELFYKNLWDLVPYEYDDVRIRYHADNIGKGYAYGGELRLFGDLVKDAESWLSVGYLKTEEQLWDEGTETWSARRARPTDQRLSFGMFFSDYLPRNKNFRVYLNLMYATGLPTHPAGKILETPARQMRLPDYKRVDIGFAALLLDGKKDHSLPLWNHFESIWVTAEVLNLLGIENTLSYQWVQDFTSDKMFAVPNRLSNRLVNIKLAVKF